jgi:sugar phosphate isomerase/epimerase
VILACQEQLLLGDEPQAKWEFARRAGFDGIELLGDAGLSARMPQLLRAREAGAVFTSICVNGSPFIGDFDPARRRQAVAHMASLVAAAGDLGAAGVVTPAAYGLFSRSLPPFDPPRGADEDRRVLVEALTELAEQAEVTGTAIFVEPLNRYEDHMLNRIEQVVELCEEIGSPALRVMADAYHMNIEEAAPEQAVRACDGRLGHVHLSDSNRYEPGAGHIDFAALFAALKGIGFAGACAVECRLTGGADAVLPEVAKRMRSAWAAA